MTDLRDQLQTTMAGSYTLDRELGGGMSRSFLADGLQLGRQMVVKVLSPELVAGISAECLELEIRLAASLQQVNIVPLLLAGELWASSTSGHSMFVTPKGTDLEAMDTASRAGTGGGGYMPPSGHVPQDDDLAL